MLPLVSIITPAYNSARHILDTIRSVREQTYPHWEMLIAVDEASTDNTCELVTEVDDPRIKIIRAGEKGKRSGVPAARNIALQHVSGRFIAFLDADDLWFPTKLEKQVTFMLENHYGFSCTSYEVIDDSGNPLGKSVYMRKKFDYKGYLTHNLIQVVGAMVDLDLVPKSYLAAPLLRRAEDAATWMQILKSGHCCYGISEVLAQYRRTRGALSENKFQSAKGVWHLYRKIEKLPFFFACYCFVRYAALAVWKRSYHA
jgi:teichuronic acid biosynthesis glycosyltransferase TuaG